MNIKPLGDRVVVKPLAQEEKNKKWYRTAGHCKGKTPAR